jgi:hypothetical protein
MLQATRTLVKSAPELWAEVADPDALAEHLGPFGTLSITDCEQERIVRWQAEHAKGELELEPAGFGTRVRLRAEAALISEPVVTPAAPLATEPAPEPKRGLWSRLMRRKPELPPLIPVQPPAPAPIPALEDDQVLAVLRDTLDALGTAHHRPFSRA